MSQELKTIRDLYNWIDQLKYLNDRMATLLAETKDGEDIKMDRIFAEEIQEVLEDTLNDTLDAEIFENEE